MPRPLSPPVDAQRPPLSLGTAAARNLATTTKTAPQMQGITPRWLVNSLPWVEVDGGTYRVNRRLSYTLGDGRVSFTSVGAEVRVVPRELRELPPLRDYEDEDVLTAVADRFVQREIRPGEVIVEQDTPVSTLVLVAHGKADKTAAGPYGDRVSLGVLGDGAFFGADLLLGAETRWGYTIRAVTPCTILILEQRELAEFTEQAPGLREHVRRVAGTAQPARNKWGEADIGIASGHAGEPSLPSTFVEYEGAPREYGLAVAQTVLNIHTRVADLYNQPMNQTEQQLRLAVAAIRERQEHDLINNREFGLLHNADLTQRIHTRSGPPTPDDLDELLSRRRKSRFFLAHPRTIAAFGRECSKRGIYPQTVCRDGHTLTAWRGVPILPCDKIPISKTRTSSILVMRTGQDSQGVVGLRQTGLPDEYQPGLSVRFMGINDQAVIKYLVSAYYSAAVLVPDALGVLENVEIGHESEVTR
jgi:hypothetical protein